MRANSTMIDMGIVKGKHVFYTGNRSLAQLIEAGEVLAIPEGDGIVFKRSEIVTPLERQAAYTLAEVYAFSVKHGENSND